jgi:hypothetical protein
MNNTGYQARTAIANILGIKEEVIIPLELE